MFSKAKIKRFNDEVGCAPAPNHYDSKLPASKKSGFSVVKSARFEEIKEQTPGPGQYLTVQDGFVKPSPQALQRSASFRVSSAKRGSRTDLSRNEVFKTPMSTPTKLRRSISTGDVSVNPSPILRSKGERKEALESRELEGLQARVSELEVQLEDAQLKLSAKQESREEEMKLRIEQLEAEMETYKAELKLREQEREESEKLAEQLNTLQLQSDYAFTLKSENDLLNQDIRTLEEELSKSKEERDKIEEELKEMRNIRKDLDAKNVFLHFTQEQLNAQVVSLETVVKNLKTENHLLNKGMKNMVEQIQQEKKKFDDLSEQYTAFSDQYNSENKEAEEAFQSLSKELEENKAKFKAMEIDLRAKLGEAEVAKAELTQSVDELEASLEVSENDKTVLKDQLEVAETATRNVTLDLAEVSKQKTEVEVLNEDLKSKNDKLQDLNNSTINDLTELTKEKNEIEVKQKEVEEEIENFKKVNKDLENELKETEMSKAGLEGANAALREEVSQLERNVAQAKSRASQYETEKDRLSEEINDMKISKQEIEESLLDYQGLVEDMDKKLVEANTNHRAEAGDLAEKLKKANVAMEEAREERSTLLEMNTALSGQVAEALQSIHSLQVREVTIHQELVMVKQIMEAAQEEGEEERMRMIQVEDEILSLQAELEDSYVRLDETVRRGTNLERENANLQSQLAQTQREMSGMKEDFTAQQGTLKSAYNSAVAELHESKTTGRQLLQQISAIEEQLESKKTENLKILKDFEDRNEEALNEMDKMVQGFEQEKSLLHDQVKHLECLRDNLEKTVSAKTEKIHSYKCQVENSTKVVEESLQKVEEVTKTNLRLKANLELRATENLKLKDQIETIKKEVELLNSETGEQKTTIKELTNVKEDLDRLRNSDMEMCLQLREKLARAQEEVEKGESAMRSMEAQQVVVMQTEACLEEEKIKNEEYLAVMRKYQERIDEMEDLMKQMDQRNDQLEEKAQSSNEQFKALEQMVEPFKEQLESFELEKNALLSRTEASQEEMNKLASQYSSLLGHQNHKQKIHHVVKLKQDNVGLKTEIENLKLEVKRAQKAGAKWEQKYQEMLGVKKFDPRLSMQPQPRNKENMVTPTVAVKESRKSTGSPLARVNRK